MIPNAGENVEKLRLSTLSWECKMKQLLENSLAGSYTTKYILNVWRSNCTVRHLSQRNENLSFQKPEYECYNISLFVTAPNWAQPTCLSAGERSRKPWYHHTTDYYRNKKLQTMIYVTTWMDLQRITLNEKNKKPILRVIHFFFLTTIKRSSDIFVSLIPVRWIYSQSTQCLAKQDLSTQFQHSVCKHLTGCFPL